MKKSLMLVGILLTIIMIFSACDSSKKEVMKEDIEGTIKEEQEQQQENTEIASKEKFKEEQEKNLNEVIMEDEINQQQENSIINYIIDEMIEAEKSGEDINYQIRPDYTSIDNLFSEFKEYPEETEYWYVGLYSTDSDDKNVKIILKETKKPVVLFLASYDDINWDFSEVENIDIKAVVLSSMELKGEVLSLPDSAKVYYSAYYPVELPIVDNYYPICYPGGECQMNVFNEVRNIIKYRIGKEMTGFGGNYDGYSMTIPEIALNQEIYAEIDKNITQYIEENRNSGLLIDNIPQEENTIDSGIEINFEKDTSEAYEGIGTEVYLKLSRSSDKEIRIPYTISGNTNPEEMYISFNGEFVLQPGETRDFLDVMPYLDCLDEKDEKYIVSVKDSKGDIKKHTVTIKDSDEKNVRLDVRYYKNSMFIDDISRGHTFTYDSVYAVSVDGKRCADVLEIGGMAPGTSGTLGCTLPIGEYDNNDKYSITVITRYGGVCEWKN